jgi:hypothetical protein
VAFNSPAAITNALIPPVRRRGKFIIRAMNLRDELLWSMQSRSGGTTRAVSVIPARIATTANVA